jgi:hypothetical protein
MPIVAAKAFTLDSQRYVKDEPLDHFSPELVAEMRRIGNIAPEPPAPPPAPQLVADPEPAAKPSRTRRGGSAD